MERETVNTGTCTKFSIVDVSLAPFWQRIFPVGNYYFDLTFPKNDPAFDRLEKWWDATKNRPSVANTICCEERVVASYADYCKGRAKSDSVKNFI